jgi:DNA-binding NarL/FixJ family response regulator
VASVVVRHLAGNAMRIREAALTPREMEVLRLVAEGLTNHQIARRLALSVRTIEAHLTHVYDKLDVASRTEAVLLAQRRGWLDGE